VADAHSHIELNSIAPQPPVIDFEQIAAAQQEDSQLQQLTQSNSSLSLKYMPAPTTDIVLLCDTSTGTPHPYVPLKFCKVIFNSLHNLSHPGVRATQKLIIAHFVWPNINANV